MKAAFNLLETWPLCITSFAFEVSDFCLDSAGDVFYKLVDRTFDCLMH